MGHSIAQKSNEPIIIAKFTEPFDPVGDGGAVAGYLINALNTSTGAIYYIADMSSVKINFSDLVAGLAAAYATPGSPYGNPRIQTFTVATDELINFGAQAAAEQQQYGKANVRFYPSQEEALAEINALLSKG